MKKIFTVAISGFLLMSCSLQPTKSDNREPAQQRKSANQNENKDLVLALENYNLNKISKELSDPSSEYKLSGGEDMRLLNSIADIQTRDYSFPTGGKFYNGATYQPEYRGFKLFAIKHNESTDEGTSIRAYTLVVSFNAGGDASSHDVTATYNISTSGYNRLNVELKKDRVVITESLNEKASPTLRSLGVNTYELLAKDFVMLRVNNDPKIKNTLQFKLIKTENGEH